MQYDEGVHNKVNFAKCSLQYMNIETKKIYTIANNELGRWVQSTLAWTTERSGFESR
jgi:hypothetical protein